MSRWDKLLRRLNQLDSSLRYEELEKILVAYGYIGESPRGGSSHVTFRKEGRSHIITIPKHKPIKKVYIEAVRDVVEQEESHNEKN